MYYLVIHFANTLAANSQTVKTIDGGFEKHTCLRTGEVEDLPSPLPLVADGDAPVADECVPLQLHAVLQHPRADLGGGGPARAALLRGEAREAGQWTRVVARHDRGHRARRGVHVVILGIN